MINIEAYQQITTEFSVKNVAIIAVSKTKPVEDIQTLYDLGQRDFGENYVQELADKQKQLPQDIRWHFIGHLQSNKVKYIAPFVHLIHSVDNEKLLLEINKQATKNDRVIDCLLQIHIAEEETKFGMDESELELLMNKIRSENNDMKNVCVKGLMSMASNTDNKEKIRSEFQSLKRLFNQYFFSSTINQHTSVISMGMSSDYQIAVEEGSSMVRIGSLLFGARKYPE